MPKVKTHLVDPKEKYRIIGEFFELVSGLKSKKEIVDFFVGLLTPSEALMMARRVQVAKMVVDGCGYDEIMKKLKVGCQTITKTEHWLHGKGEEYGVWIERRLKESAKEKKKPDQKYSTSMLDKYPEYRLWKNLLS